LRTLVKVGNANLEARDSHGKTVLLAAIHTTLSILPRKDLPAILELIALGAKIDAADEDGNGIFHHDVKGQNGRFLEELTPRLCAAEADINRPNDRSEAPIHLTGLFVSNGTSLNSPGKISRTTTPFEILITAGA
jgi:ankyrin repeat protein